MESVCTVRVSFEELKGEVGLYEILVPTHPQRITARTRDIWDRLSCIRPDMCTFLTAL